jgi:Mg2+ and Co2+ transporter CorA
MRSIAVVGLVYLPGTFVSGLFGMNFFDFSEESGVQTWNISSKFWLYWAITIPLTLVTIFVWVLAFHGEALKWPGGRRKKVLEAGNVDAP